MSTVIEGVFKQEGQADIVLPLLVDNTGKLLVTSESAGDSSIDRELVVTTYRCKTAFTGASIGDVITCTQIIDVTDVPTTVSTIWRNQTTATNLASAPSAENIEVVGSQALTNAELRSSDVAVITPLPVSPITGQGVIITTGMAIALPSNVLKNGIIVKSSAGNTQPLFIGGSTVTNTDDGTGNGYKLDAGEAISFAVSNSNSVFVNGNAGSIFYYAGN